MLMASVTMVNKHIGKRKGEGEPRDFMIAWSLAGQVLSLLLLACFGVVATHGLLVVCCDSLVCWFR
jgi:hypothetical protein